MLTKMAFKNVFRNRKRTVVTIAAIFYSVVFISVFNGFNLGLEWQIRDQYVKTYCGDFEVVGEDYAIDEMKNPIEYPLKNHKAVEKELARDKNVKAYSSRITFQGGLYSDNADEEDDAILATGIGIDPVQEDAVFTRSKSIIAGRYLKPGEKGVVIGADLADLFDLKVGDKVEVMVQPTKMGAEPVARRMNVAGLIRTGNPLIDGEVFFITLDMARSLLSYAGITEIAVKLKDGSQFDKIIDRFKQPGFERKASVLTWRDFSEGYISIVEIRKRMINILSAIVLTIAAIGIINTMLMAMAERKREIGNLMAQGVRQNEIIRLFVIEGMAIGFIGSLAAAVVGSVIILLGQKYGVPMDLSKLENAPIAGKLYFYFNPLDIARYFLMGTVTGALATIYPAVKTAKLEPVEALSGRG